MKNGHGTMFQEALAAYKPSQYLTAVAEFTALAEKGDAAAQNNLGNMYYSGLGVAQNDEKAIKWLRPAAEAGIVEAQYTLGCLYNFGRRSIEDDAEAAKWYRLAAEAGHVESQYRLAIIYEEDGYVEEIPTDRAKWRKNSAKAAKWFRLAAKAGHDKAQTAMGTLHHFGMGVKQDYCLAYKWFTLAAAQGDDFASITRHQTINEMTPEQIAEAEKMVEQYLNSAAHGSSPEIPDN